MANCLDCGTYLGAVDQSLCDRCYNEAGGRFSRTHPLLAALVVLVPIVFYGWLMMAGCERTRAYHEDGRRSAMREDRP